MTHDCTLAVAWRDAMARTISSCAMACTARMHRAVIRHALLRRAPCQDAGLPRLADSSHQPDVVRSSAERARVCQRG